MLSRLFFDRHIHKITWLCFYVIFSVFLTGCGSASAVLKPSYSKSNFKENRNNLKCPIELKVFDQRREKSAYFKSLSSADLETWFSNVFHKLYYVPTNSKFNDYPIINVEVNIEKTYVSHYATSISGVMLFQASINGDTKYYRGQKQATNMWGAASEYDSLLNKSLSIALQKLHIKLISACKQQQELSAR